VLSALEGAQVPKGAGNQILEVEDLVRAFGGVRAVDGASFSVPAGQITGLIGPNGAGKSTLLNVIAGTDRPTAGRVRFQGGEDITGLPAHRLARRGIVRTFQLSSEFGRLTVLENLVVAAPHQRGSTFWGALRSKRFWGPEESRLILRAQDLLERFSMAHAADQYAGELSGGQKRLVEIMRALMAEPQVLLLDEPLAGVLPSLARTVEEHLLSLRREGLSMLLVEHELGAVERLTDSVIVMAQGRVLARGTMADMREHKEVVDAYLVG
jgi:ABC-type branched-subunit amino acid transport system ATPase component